MTESTKTLLIVGGLAMAGFLAYKYITAVKNNGRIPTGGLGSTGTPGGHANSTTGGNWWDSIGSIGTTAGSVIGTIDNTYNSIYSFFGGSSGSNDTGSLGQTTPAA